MTGWVSGCVGSRSWWVRGRVVGGGTWNSTGTMRHPQKCNIISIRATHRYEYRGKSTKAGCGHFAESNQTPGQTAAWSSGTSLSACKACSRMTWNYCALSIISCESCMHQASTTCVVQHIFDLPSPQSTLKPSFLSTSSSPSCP